MLGKRTGSTKAWSERLLAVLVIAAGLAAIDQWVKLEVPTPAWAVHHRSDLWFLSSCVVLVAILAVTRLPSRGLSIAAGFLAGGVLGNLLSASSDGRDVPNPIIVMHGMGGVAFNPADAFIEAGNVALIGTLVYISLRHREELALWRARARSAWHERLPSHRGR